MGYLFPTAGAARESLASTAGVGGVTATAAELNILDGATPTYEQLNQATVPTVVTATSSGDITLTTTQNRSYVTNTFGTTHVCTVNLPAAAAGLEFDFICGSTVQFIVKPNGTDAIGIPTSGAYGTSGLSIAATVKGNAVKLAAIAAGRWSVLGSAGTTGWTTT